MVVMVISMNRKIMIVDDEEDILLALKTFFEEHDFDVITYTKGRECIKEIERGFRGIVFIDIMMPGMDGWDTIKELVNRDLIDHVSVKVITGKGTKDHNKIALLAPYITDYISKPVDTDLLLSLVES
jgi:DNA-binding response OmpR family regulator